MTGLGNRGWGRVIGLMCLAVSAYGQTGFVLFLFAEQGSVAWQQLEGKNDVKAPVVCETRTRALAVDDGSRGFGGF